MKDDTFRFNGKRHQLICKDTDPSLAKKKVIIEQRLNGRMAVRFGRNYFVHHEIS
jgi:hypothetical protein